MKYLILLLGFVLNTLVAATTQESISLQLSWLHQFQSAGFYIAKEKGFYKDVGLDVTIKEFTSNTDVIEDVLTQKSQYGIGRSSLVVDRANRKPIIALMALFQNTPSVLISINPSIKLPQDLARKMIMMTEDETSSVAILGMLLSHGVRRDDITLQPHSFNLEDLIEGKTDAMACYISNEPFLLTERHIPHTIFSPKQYGFDFYGDILFTSEKEIMEHPERVKKFYEASKKGWEWAFANIKESAKIIYEHYNTQSKSLDALIYEGSILKQLAYEGEKPFGTIERKKFEDIANLYKLSGLLKNGYSLEGFVDPLHLGKQPVKIGVLANRGDKKALELWKESAQYLSNVIPTHHFNIEPLDFQILEEKVKDKSIDFVITNPLYYTQLEHLYGASRIATLSTLYKDRYYAQYGSVIFTRSDTKKVHTVNDLEKANIGAVHPNSFGGFVMVRKELNDPEYLKQTQFFQTHDDVVNAVLSQKIDVGIVRTDILEHMQEEGLIQLSDIKVIGAKNYPNFPFLVSTELYPEWPFVKLQHTSEELSNNVLSALLQTSFYLNPLQEFKWKTPLDYSKVNYLLKELRMFPYDDTSFTLIDVIEKYPYQFILLFLFLGAIFMSILRIQKLNHQLKTHAQEIERFNATLEEEVKERTHELTLLNTKLKELANTDELTKIHNRRHFLQLASFYFHSAKRHRLPLYILSLDIDFFKHVNDTHGHHVGDDVLKLFCTTVTKSLRKDDLFGRIGGEEFSICVQNTPLEGILILAEKIRASVEESVYKKGHDLLIRITVSIGISGITPSDETIFDIMKRSDDALYIAKESGRNQVRVQ